MDALLSSKPATVCGTRRPEQVETVVDGVGTRPRPAGPLASFARFVLCGGGVGVVSSGAVALTAEVMPWVMANALITIASTLLCTELHARFTFGAGRRAGWRQHWQSAGSATAAYAVTCAAMFVLHAVQASPGMLWEQTVYLGAAGLAGIGRFLVLRLYVFATDRPRATVRATRPAWTEAATGSAPLCIPAPALAA
ncbi:GtrA family protein [Streptomyces sp. NPDC005485]|uniref:GtrA family protein n=1 Tax=Streptomyces sp. NPDC005485 TaxID=3155591 RepID=UPI0033ACE592